MLSLLFQLTFSTSTYILSRLFIQLIFNGRQLYAGHCEAMTIKTWAVVLFECLCPSPPHSYVEILMPNGMALGVEPLGGACQEGGAPMNGILILFFF